MLKLNIDKLRDKIYACWLGKNIGGTIGTPYEGKRELLDVKGFSTPKGTVLPNDDLDLQLIWLKAIEDHGAQGITPQLLGEYWLSYITPGWNEYGTGKANMRMGLMPPLSGEYSNSAWKNSNGAWIRSEIWACTAPYHPDIAIKYAVCDAVVDHGISEGTYAEMFTAAVESAAFGICDIKKLIQIGLARIPENCRTARSIKLALQAYEQGETWQQARQTVLDDSADMGWFQAPANVAYTVIGLLYGEGDFKKTVLTAVNCGDDTDCTGATAGALLGIMYGMKVIPEDWRVYLGDNIVTVSINRGSIGGIPATCTELTERVVNLVQAVLKANRVDVMLTSDGDDVPTIADKSPAAQKLYSQPANSFTVELAYISVCAELLDMPKIKPFGQVRVRLHFTNKYSQPMHLKLRYLPPEGFTASGEKSIYLNHFTAYTNCDNDFVDVVITAGENVEAVNRIVVEVIGEGRCTAAYVPIVLLG